MAITAAGNGNWSAGGTWTGGVVPGNGDIADLNGFTVTMDIATIPAVGTLLGITSAGSAGVLVIGGVAGDNVINATTLTAGTVGTTGTFQYSGAVCNKLTINFTNIVGCAAGGTSPRCLVRSSTKDLILNGGTVTGAAVSGGRTVYSSAASGTITANCNAQGGSATSTAGIYFQGGTLNFTGNATGGSGLLSYGIEQSGGGTTTNITGNLTGGTGTAASGLYSGSSNTITLTSCNLFNGTGGVALGGVPPATWNLVASTHLQWVGINFYQYPRFFSGDISSSSIVRGALVFIWMLGGTIASSTVFTGAVKVYYLLHLGGTIICRTFINVGIYPLVAAVRRFIEAHGYVMGKWRGMKRFRVDV